MNTVNTVKLKSKENCRNWMRNFVEPSRKPAAEVIQAGKAQGYSDAELQRAKKDTGIKSIKQTVRGPWFWYLPEHLGKKTVNVVNSRSPESPNIQKAEVGEFPVNHRMILDFNSANSRNSKKDGKSNDNSAVVNKGDNNGGAGWWTAISILAFIMALILPAVSGGVIKPPAKLK
jgi:hypothetical protein